MELDRERILELVKLLQDSSAAELTVQEEGVRVRLVRGLAPAFVPVAAVAAPVSPIIEEATVEAPAMVVPPPAQPADDATLVTSRVVGLFYRGKEPGGPALVEVGQTVTEGQPLGIVEVLRKPTTVTSPAAGTVTEVLVEEGAGVQYGDPLFVIRS